MNKKKVLNQIEILIDNAIHFDLETYDRDVIEDIYSLIQTKKTNYVSQSVFQTLKEENKKLLADIRIMALDPGFNAIHLRMQWRDKFKKDAAFDAMIKAFCTQYVKDHPEYDIMNPSFKLDKPIKKDEKAHN